MYKIHCMYMQVDFIFLFCNILQKSCRQCYQIYLIRKMVYTEHVYIFNKFDYLKFKLKYQTMMQNLHTLFV